MGTMHVLLAASEPTLLAKCAPRECDVDSLEAMLSGVSNEAGALCIELPPDQMEALMGLREQLRAWSERCGHIVWIAAVSATDFFGYFHFHQGDVSRTMILGQTAQFTWDSVGGNKEAWEDAALSPKNGEVSVEVDAMNLALAVRRYWKPVSPRSSA